MSRTDLTCPACGKPADAGEGIHESTERAPAAGDPTVCASCGELLAFAQHPRARRRLVLARLTPEQLGKLDAFTRIALQMAKRAVLTRAEALRKPTVFN